MIPRKIKFDKKSKEFQQGYMRAMKDYELEKKLINKNKLFEIDLMIKKVNKDVNKLEEKLLELHKKIK